MPPRISKIGNVPAWARLFSVHAPARGGRSITLVSPPCLVEFATNSLVPYHPAAISPEGPTARVPDLAPAPPKSAGTLPINAFVRDALGMNRLIQSACFNVPAMNAWIPQVMALEGRLASNVS